MKGGCCFVWSFVGITHGWELKELFPEHLFPPAWVYIDVRNSYWKKTKPIFSITSLFKISPTIIDFIPKFYGTWCSCHRINHIIKWKIGVPNFFFSKKHFRVVSALLEKIHITKNHEIIHSMDLLSFYDSGNTSTNQKFERNQK